MEEEIPRSQIFDLLPEQDQRAIETLEIFRTSARFGLAENKQAVETYINSSSKPGFVTKSERRIPIDDFLRAIDYLCVHRSSEAEVEAAMAKSEGTKQ